MKPKLIINFLLVLTLALSLQAQSPLYSFFVAGHAYGNPNNPQYGLHPPLVNYIPEIRNYPGMELGVFTGDVVVISTAAYWDSAAADMSLFNMPLYIAAGNHDIGPEFVSRFGAYYYSFQQHDDLFIVLTPGLDAWNISGDQLTFLVNTLDSNYQSVNRIFIFLHELIWWSPTNVFQNVMINYVPHFPGSTNYESVVKPLLLSYPNPITLYAGDLGATDVVSPCMYYHSDNITLIASGMGGGIQDNIIITEVYADSLYHNLVSLNGSDPKAMGELMDYTVVSVEEKQLEQLVCVYPNPAQEHFYIRSTAGEALSCRLYSPEGKLLLSRELAPKAFVSMDVRTLTAGLYFLSFQGQQGSILRKLLVY